MAREGEHRGGGFEWPDLATAVVSAVLTAVAVGVVLLPIYGALWPGGGEEGACSDRHAQDVLGGIGDSPVEARVHLVDGILECVWPAAGGGTHTLTYPVTVLDVHRWAMAAAALCAVVTAVFAVRASRTAWARYRLRVPLPARVSVRGPSVGRVSDDASTPVSDGPAQDATTGVAGAPPWEPPTAGDEVGHLLGALDRLRTTFRWKADGLDADGLRAHVGSSALTLGSLLKHLAFVEDEISTWRLAGASPGEPWTTSGVPVEEWADWVFTSAADDDPADLYALWDGAVARSRARFDAALADGGLDQEVHLAFPDGQHLNLRRLLFDLVEEYGRHTGHADLLREAVDGRVGEDPPDGWRPVVGQEPWRV